MVNKQELRERATKPIFLIKVVQVVLMCVCLRCVGGQYAALLEGSHPEDDDSDYKGVFPLMTAMRLQLTVYTAFLVLMLVTITCYLLDRSFHYIVVMIIGSAAATVFLTGAAVNIEIFMQLIDAKKKTMVGAVAGILNFVVILVDILLEYHAAHK